jgi:hypothetical protein
VSARKQFLGMHGSRGLSPRASAIVAQARPVPGPALIADVRRAIVSLVEAQASGLPLREADLLTFLREVNPELAARVDALTEADFIFEDDENDD